MTLADQKKLKKKAVGNLKVNGKDSGTSSTATLVEDQSKIRQPQCKYSLRVIHQPNAN